MHGDSRAGFVLPTSVFAKAFAALEKESPSPIDIRNQKARVLLQLGLDVQGGRGGEAKVENCKRALLN